MLEDVFDIVFAVGVELGDRCGLDLGQVVLKHLHILGGDECVGVKTDEPQTAYVFACRVHDDMKLVRKTFLQSVERFQVAVRFDTVVGRIAFPSC